MQAKLEDTDNTANGTVLNSTASIIRTLEEWEAWKEKADTTGLPVLLQCGSPTCVRCPEFSAQITTLESEYRFHYIYCNTHDAEEDLIEELLVTQLPAYFLVKGTEMALGQSSKPRDVSDAIHRMCPPKLVLDGEF